MELIIDTSSDELIVILKDKTKIYQSEKLHGKHQETLLPQIDFLLKSAGKEPKDINLYAVVVGPGSFTGVRLAVSTVKAFCSVFDAKVIGINMLELLGEKLKDGQAVAIKCTGQKVYFARKEGVELHKSVCLNEVLLPLLETKNLFGYNLGKVGEEAVPQITLEPKDYINFVDKETEKKNFVSAQKLEPVYMALSQAEEELLKKEQTEIIPFEDKYAEDMFQLQDTVIPTLDKMSKKSFMTEFEESTRTYFVAKRGDIVVGYIGLLSCDTDQNIVSLAVKEELWGQGIGSELVSHAIAFAKDNGNKTLSLEVDEKNDRAVSFYKKMGFEVTNVRKKYYKDNDAFVMFLKI